MISSKALLRLIFALFGSLCCAGVYSASFPERSIRLIVPTTQGGGADTIARNIGVRLSESWAQQVIVDNRPGANGISGVDAAASATPDGHTILLTFTDHFVNPSLYRSLPFDMIKDFAPVIYVGSLPFVLAVNPAVPANSVREDDDSTLVPMVSAPEYFWVVLAGGDGRHSAWMPAWNVCQGASEVVTLVEV